MEKKMQKLNDVVVTTPAERVPGTRKRKGRTNGRRRS